MSDAAPGFILPDWPAPPAVRAAFSLRGGGVSAPPWDSLNLGAHVGDDPAAVRENRRRLREALRLPSEPLWLEQVHGVAVFRDGVAHGAAGGPGPGIGPSPSPSPSPRPDPGHGSAAPDPGSNTNPRPATPIADACVTARRGVVATIMVADCIPVLFCDRAGTVVGAAHAGWRGLVAGVLENTVAAMGVPPGQLLAWLGPAIGPERFEVGDEVRETFLGSASGSAAARHFRRSPAGRWLCDLPGLARDRLAHAGVGAVHGGQECTASDPGRFFSHRRDAPRTGRMAAFVWLEC